MKYYLVRVVEAQDHAEATEMFEERDFDDEDVLHERVCYGEELLALMVDRATGDKCHG